MTNRAWLPPELEVMAEQVTGRGARGVVCAAAPLAALAGAEALRDGGNAYDAAVAAALAETVLLPPKCGLGGDLVALVVPAGATHAESATRAARSAVTPPTPAPAPVTAGAAATPPPPPPAPVAPEALLAIGGAPAGLAAVAMSGRWREVGPFSVAPPGAPAGYLALAARGRLPLDRLAAPAIALARDGFPWARVCTALSEQAAELVAELNPDGCAYYPDGRPFAPGAVVRLPRLADALEALVAERADLLLGPLGGAIVAAVQVRGGVLTRDDLAHAHAEWTSAAPATAGPRQAWATPAPTHGPALLDAVSGAQPGDSAAATHARVMSAIAGRRATLADPSGTSMVSAADASGVVVVVHSNSFPRFGSGIVVPEFDLVLANRAGRGFTPEPGHPNFPAAGRRPATTLHAWAVADAAGHPRLVGATPGGENQLPWNAQLLGQVVAGVNDPGLLVSSPRWAWVPGADGIEIEAGFSPDDEAALVAAASGPARSVGRWALTSGQQVVRVRRDGEAFTAAADPRTGGLALGV